MYFPYFITYMALGALITIPVFIWALKSGQFKNQERARFLPLEGEPEAASPVKVSKMNRFEAYALLALAVLGLMTSAAVLVFALTSAKP